MPRTDDPATRSIFDLLEEKYSPNPISASAASGPGRRPAMAAGPSSETGIDSGSRSLLLASLVAVLATALVTLSLKPDLPSAIVDASPQAALRAAAAPTSEIGLRTLAAEPVAEPVRQPAPEAAAEPAAVATLTVARPEAEAPPQVTVPVKVLPVKVPVTESDPAPVRVAPPVRAASRQPAAEIEAQPRALPQELSESGSPEPAPLDEAPEVLPRQTPDLLPEAPAAVPPAAEIDPPVRLVTPLPSYTQDAWVAGVQGDVLVRARIDKEGTVADVQVLRGLPHGLTEAAVAAVRRWRFRPASIDGVPVSIDHDLSIRFSL